MNKKTLTLTLCILVVLTGCSLQKDISFGIKDNKSQSAATGNVEVNTLPMYGGMDKTESIDEFKKLGNQRFVESKNTVELGWQYYNQKDFDTAMKRFNQAWMLDQENPDVFWGFGIISAEKGNIDDAIKYLKMAYQLGPKNSEIAYNLGYMHSQKSYASNLSKTDKDFNLNEAIKYFEQATLINPKVDYYYGEWASALYELGQYEASLKKVELAEMYGKGDPVFRKMVEEKIKK
ncbi:MAG: Tetratricopeptide TPR_1 repeat-containing protein [Candidatus Falkowbacteria bacterium GW2011_GWF2_39_8]|uniref:Tetratricopeptide TPR_1 repeat-containing protein n=1 Tax=Candidatus Falkowbacteria bacterium GW2011_GWF2_39_8 TaxID=1618642 RepID=A0A0G0T1R8_9BACT|nr:MAG: Tetratricopeptide TPR_1 repeat-containing protein [Candidatus Falkowbacteria bacterium GW2011_GWF2_39_8]